MIEIHSEIVGEIIYSEVVDFEQMEEDFRLLEDGQIRDLEDDNKRLLE